MPQLKNEEYLSRLTSPKELFLSSVPYQRHPLYPVEKTGTLDSGKIGGFLGQHNGCSSNNFALELTSYMNIYLGQNRL
jgi:hypothetical protein